MGLDRALSLRRLADSVEGMNWGDASGDEDLLELKMESVWSEEAARIFWDVW